MDIRPSFMATTGGEALPLQDVAIDAGDSAVMKAEPGLYTMNIGNVMVGETSSPASPAPDS